MSELPAGSSNTLPEPAQQFHAETQTLFGMKLHALNVSPADHRSEIVPVMGSSRDLCISFASEVISMDKVEPRGLWHQRAIISVGDRYRIPTHVRDFEPFAILTEIEAHYVGINPAESGLAS